MTKTIIAALVLAALVGHDAPAQSVVTICQNIVGKSLTPPAQWDEDAITGGSVTVTRNGTKYDLIIKDTNATFSALADVAKITRLDGDDDKDFTLAFGVS